MSPCSDQRNYWNYVNIEKSTWKLVCGTTGQCCCCVLYILTKSNWNISKSHLSELDKSQPVPIEDSWTKSQKVYEQQQPCTPKRQPPLFRCKVFQFCSIPHLCLVKITWNLRIPNRGTQWIFLTNMHEDKEKTLVDKVTQSKIELIWVKCKYNFKYLSYVVSCVYIQSYMRMCQ